MNSLPAEARDRLTSKLHLIGGDLLDYDLHEVTRNDDLAPVFVDEVARALSEFTPTAELSTLSDAPSQAFVGPVNIAAMSVRLKNLLMAHQLLDWECLAPLRLRTLAETKGMGRHSLEELYRAALTRALDLPSPHNRTVPPASFRAPHPSRGASPDARIEHLKPPSLLTSVLARLEAERGIVTVSDLAHLELDDVRTVRGVGSKKIRALANLQAAAQAICRFSQEHAVAFDHESEDVDDEPTANIELLAPDLIGEVLVAAHVVYGATTVDDLAGVDWRALFNRTGLLPRAEAVELRSLVPSAFNYFDIVSTTERALAALPDRRREILLQFELSDPGKRRTLSDVGKDFDLTRERVRQLKVMALESFEDATHPVLPTMAKWLVVKAGGACRIATLFNLMGGQFRDHSADGARVAFNALLYASEYDIDGEWATTRVAKSELASAKVELIQAAENRGVIPESAIRDLCDPIFRLRSERDAYLEHILGFERMEGQWIRKGSQRVRVVAALAILGAPATKDQIGKLAGVDPARVGAVLSGRPGVCRADKDRWAFEEWVDDPYDGIVGEILQRINEDGGVTTVKRLVTELPEKFKVSETSVRSYLATPRFVVTHGTVRLASESEIASTYYGEVSDISNAVQLDDGTWAAKILVEDRFFDGYSAALPVPVAQAGGLKPGDSVVVPVVGTDHKVSLIWRLENTGRVVDFGRIAPLLADLRVVAGDILVVAPCRASVRVYQLDDAPLGFVEEIDDDPSSDVDALISALFSR